MTTQPPKPPRRPIQRGRNVRPPPELMRPLEHPPRHGRPAPPVGSPPHSAPSTRPPSRSAPATGPADGSWEHVASWYDSLLGERGSEFHQAVIVPGLLRLLGLRKSERALDLACGQGAVSLALHAAGAEVLGVDLSQALITKARQRAPQGVRFLVGDARNLSAQESGSFDAAVCVLAAQNIDPIAPMFSECARLLRAGGRAVFIVPHPAFRVPRQSSWQWDEPRKLLYREVDRYLEPLKVPIDMRPFRSPGAQLTWTYHRPMGSYVNGLATAGLWTNALEEWASHKASQPGPKASAENRARKEFPLFLAVRAVKVAALNH